MTQPFCCFHEVLSLVCGGGGLDLRRFHFYSTDGYSAGFVMRLYSFLPPINLRDTIKVVIRMSRNTHAHISLSGWCMLDLHCVFSSTSACSCNLSIVNWVYKKIGWSVVVVLNDNKKLLTQEVSQFCPWYAIFDMLRYRLGIRINVVLTWRKRKEKKRKNN